MTQMRMAGAAALLLAFSAGPIHSATTPPQTQSFSLSLTSSQDVVFQELAFAGFDSALGTLLGVSYVLDVTALSSDVDPGDINGRQTFRVDPRINTSDPFFSFDGAFEGALPFLTSAVQADDLDASRFVDETDIDPTLLANYITASVPHRIQLEQEFFNSASVSGSLTISYDFEAAQAVPLPAAGLLLLTGLGALGALRLRSRSEA